MKNLKLSPNMQAAMWYRAGASYNAVMRAFPLCKISDVQYNALIGRDLVQPVGASAYMLTTAGRAWIVEQVEAAHGEALRENADRYTAHSSTVAQWEQAHRMLARAGMGPWVKGMIARDHAEALTVEEAQAEADAAFTAPRPYPCVASETTEAEAHEMDRRLDEADIIAARLGFEAHGEALIEYATHPTSDAPTAARMLARAGLMEYPASLLRDDIDDAAKVA